MLIELDFQALLIGAQISQKAYSAGSAAIKNL